MESKRLIPPEQQNYEYAYGMAYQLARERLAKIDDIAEQCRRSGTQYQVTDSRETVIVQYLDQSYQITLPDADVSLVDSSEAVPIREKVLILHYFISAQGVPPANRLITFRELPEGTVYSPTFEKRTIRPLLARFGEEPRLLFAASEKMGGRQADYGDTAVTISAFNRVPITIILWQGDDEFAPQGNIVFDANVSDYLATEDITVLCETITWRLIRSLR